jgi:hypothetical protein
MKTGENMRRHCDDKPFMGILSIGWRLEWWSDSGDRTCGMKSAVQRISGLTVNLEINCLVRVYRSR